VWQRLTPLDGRLSHRLEVYKDPIRGYCTRTQADHTIQRGEFLCLFAGEVIDGVELAARGRDPTSLVDDYSMALPCVSPIVEWVWWVEQDFNLKFI
jgi:hypothetical protein